MLAATGSTRSAATSCSASAASTAARSFHGTTTVSAAIAGGTPGLPGTDSVAIPEPPSASSPSEWPW